MKKRNLRSEISIVVLIVVLFAVFSFMSAEFFTWKNIALILSQSTSIAIMGIGMTMVVILGGMDLSIGSVVSLTATVTCILMLKGVPIPAAILAGILAGMLCGFINGWIIATLGIPDIIVSLATMYIFRGAAIAVSQSQWMTNFPEAFDYLGKGTVLNIPFPAVVTLVLAVIFSYVLAYTMFGRKIYACGGNLEAAKISGIHYKKIKITVYVISGMLAAVSAVLYASKVGSIQASSAGTTFSNDVLAAALIGGASLYGGIGTIFGTVAGALLLGMIKNALILIKVSTYWIDAITGGMILAAMLISTYQQIRKKKELERGLV